jgi:hypothetical protein
MVGHEDPHVQTGARMTDSHPGEATGGDAVEHSDAVVRGAAIRGAPEGDSVAIPRIWNLRQLGSC